MDAGPRWLLLCYAVQDPSPKNGVAHFRVGLPNSVSQTRISPHRHGHGLTKSRQFSQVCLWACILSGSGTCAVDSASLCTGFPCFQAPPRGGLHYQEHQAASGTIMLMTSCS